MTIKTTRFSPDSCGCSVEYTWDDTQTEAVRTHTFARAVRKCNAHSAQTDLNAYNTCIEENQRKNIALGVALDNGPTGLYDTIDGTRQLKPVLSYNYSWSGTAPNRVLTISFTGISLTSTQRNSIQTAENTRFGNGKVSVV